MGPTILSLQALLNIIILLSRYCVVCGSNVCRVGGVPLIGALPPILRFLKRNLTNYGTERALNFQPFEWTVDMGIEGVRVTGELLYSYGAPPLRPALMN